MLLNKDTVFPIKFSADPCLLSSPNDVGCLVLALLLPFPVVAGGLWGVGAAEGGALRPRTTAG